MELNAITIYWWVFVSFYFYPKHKYYEDFSLMNDSFCVTSLSSCPFIHLRGVCVLSAHGVPSLPGQAFHCMGVTTHSMF
jgi:hypothetical protein